MKEKLSPKFEGPFKVVKRIGEVQYKLALCPNLMVYDVFHVSKLIRCFRDPAQQMHLAYIQIVDSCIYVEKPVWILVREAKNTQRKNTDLVKEC